MMRLAMNAVALTLVVSSQALAQTPQERINKGLERARTTGIPVELLESKIAEGKAKGVSLERIAAAIERRLAALERASQVMRGPRDAGPAGLAVAADAVEAGVSDAVLAAIAESAPRERRAVAISALTELVKLGHAPERALERVRAALARGPEALANLPAEARRDGDRRPDPARQRPGGDGNRGRPDPGPPNAVPAPGRQSQPSRPGNRPETPPGRSAGAGR
jgi:hypothetical protein